jgi:Zn-dependent protease
MKCEYCGQEESLPFVCNYCGGVFCASHRLPEAHACKGDLTAKRTIIAPPPTTFSWQTSSGYTAPPPTQAHQVFSKVEVKDIIIAWVGLGFAFLFGAFPGPPTNSGPGGISGVTNWLSGVGRYNIDPPTFLFVSLVTVGTGFVLHELSHKFTAQRYGYWAEFRMWPLGLLLALGTSLLGFIFAAPGATYISGSNISQEQNGKISLAGPLTNVAVAVFFLPFLLFGSYLGGLWEFLGLEGVYINVFLALFNLLPILPLDGAKVFGWSKAIWASVFLPLVVVFLFFLVG